MELTRRPDLSISHQKGDIIGKCIYIEERGFRLVDGTREGRRVRTALFKCPDCDNEFVADLTSVKSERIKSCCKKNYNVERARKLNYTHGMSRTRIYNIWYDMRKRCTRTTHPSYHDYGGRGIKVCDRWMESFENFYEDMKEGYTDNLTIERIEVNSGYYKENCKWATQQEQCQNTRKTWFIEYQGKKYCAAELCRIIGLSYSTFCGRVKRLGWTIEKALTYPIKEQRN